MSITVFADNDEVFEIDEYIDHVERHVDLSDPESIMASAPALRALANNKKFLTRKLNDDLVAATAFQPLNSYTAQTLLLGVGRGFHIRANVWMPRSENPRVSEWQESLFVYGFAHDHNFNFLTVGYHGPGYETDLWEYDRRGLEGRPGERVSLIPRGREKLDQGKVMFYRACRDVHTQHPPESFSVSLNLMIETRDLALVEQYSFDTERGVLLGAVHTGASRSFLFELPRYFGDGATVNALERLAAEHPSARVRATALESLSLLEPECGESVQQRLSRSTRAPLPAPPG